jgi:uncharacterized repeat protein (TIGR01451 family)
MNAIMKKLLVTAGVVAAVSSAPAAYAAGTASGTTITNNVDVSYQVGATTYNATQASDAIIVDRKIALTLTETGSVTTPVTLGQTNAATSFTLTNNSNATVDVLMTAAQLSGGTAAHGGTDVFDLTTTTIYVDVNNDGLWDAGDTVLAGNYVNDLAADASIRLLIVGDIPTSQTNGQVAGVTLSGQAREASGTAAANGAAITATVGANTAGVDTVLQDSAFAGVAGDNANDGRVSDDDDYTVSAPTITVFKTSSVVWDPVNLGANPKMIPGARIEYCLIVVNSGAAAANNVTISDTLPATLAYYSGNYIVRVGGTYTGTAPTGTCNTDGTSTAAAQSGQLISSNIGSVAAGATRTIQFQATIQ